MVTRLTSTGARFGPGGISVALYCEMMPQSGMRANGLTFLNTALRTSPPTLSKYTSMPLGQASRSTAARSGRRWDTQASKPSSFRTYSHLSLVLAMPATRQPRIFASWPTTEPTAPAAADTTTVSPGLGWAMS